MTTSTAPDLTTGYPSKGKKLGPAWNGAWTHLAKAKRRQDQFLDGRELAEVVAPDYGLSSATLVALFSRMATGGLLDRESRPVNTKRGVRMRTFYKIKESA